MDEFLHLNSASHPALLPGGRLRPLVEAAFAAQIMYYNERREAGEMIVFTDKLRNIVMQKFKDSTADKTLKDWGQIIRIQFNSDNLPLTARSTDSEHVQILQALTDLGKSVSSLHSNQRLLSDRMQSLEDSIKAVEVSECGCVLVWVCACVYARACPSVCVCLCACACVCVCE